MIIDLNYRVDILKGIVSQNAEHPLYYDDQNAHRVNVSLYRGQEEIDLSGLSCNGYVVFVKEGASIGPLTGEVSNNTCSVVLPHEAYQHPGAIRVEIKLIEGDSVTTVLMLTGHVSSGRGDRVIDITGSIVPSLDSLKATIEELEGRVAAIEVSEVVELEEKMEADVGDIYMDPWQLVAKKYFIPDSSGNLTVRRNHITYTPSASQSSPAVRSLIGSYEGTNTTLGRYTPTIDQLIPVSVFGDAIKIGFYLDAVGTNRYPRFAYKFCTVNGETVTPISGAQGSLPETAATGVLAETTAAVPDGATHVFFGLLYSNGYTENATYDMVYKVDKG